MALLATIALIAVVLLGVLRERLPMSGTTWRILHAFLATLVIALGFGHAILTDGARRCAHGRPARVWSAGAGGRRGRVRGS